MSRDALQLVSAVRGKLETDMPDDVKKKGVQTDPGSMCMNPEESGFGHENWIGRRKSSSKQ